MYKYEMAILKLIFAPKLCASDWAQLLRLIDSSNVQLTYGGVVAKLREPTPSHEELLTRVSGVVAVPTLVKNVGLLCYILLGN